jgi:hypothetical protein
MSTATQATRKIKSPKYPGWEIEKFSDVDYLMTRPDGIFAIAVSHSEVHGWFGELLTMQRRDGVKSWEPARTPYSHAVVGCVQEADRREKAIRRHAVKPLVRLAK